MARRLTSCTLSRNYLWCFVLFVVLWIVSFLFFTTAAPPKPSTNHARPDLTQVKPKRTQRKPKSPELFTAPEFSPGKPERWKQPDEQFASFKEVGFHQSGTNEDLVYIAISKNLNHTERLLRYCILDIGANDGETVKQFMILFRRSDIFAFEPIEATFRKLQKGVESFKKFGAGKQIEAVFKGKTSSHLDNISRDLKYDGEVIFINSGVGNSEAQIAY